MKQRSVVHNEYFRTVLLGGRKSCPQCKVKLCDGEKIWSWGEYHNVRWYTVQHFCKQCWHEVQARLRQHSWQCHCTYNLVRYGAERLPTWLTLEGDSND